MGRRNDLLLCVLGHRSCYRRVASARVAARLVCGGDPFCSALLKHHYPDVRNYGDFTKIGDDTGPIDKEVGTVPEAKPTESST